MNAKKSRKAKVNQKEDLRLKENRHQTTLLQDIAYLIMKLAIIGILFILLFTFMFGIIRNREATMQPSIKDGDLVITYRLDREYIARDCVVIEYEGQRQIRRVIAVAGDIVDITEEGLLINGALQRETAIYEETQLFKEGIDFPLTIKEGQVFVLGDSREQSVDSRIYGAVNQKDILGKVMLVIRRRSI